MPVTASTQKNRNPSVPRLRSGLAAAPKARSSPRSSLTHGPGPASAGAATNVRVLVCTSAPEHEPAFARAVVDHPGGARGKIDRRGLGVVEAAARLVAYAHHDAVPAGGHRGAEVHRGIAVAPQPRRRHRALEYLAPVQLEGDSQGHALAR